MKMRILSKKTLAIFLSLTMLLSCMVWSGVSAETSYFTDFTGYSTEALGAADASAEDTGATAALVEDAGDGQGAAMRLSYISDSPSFKDVGFRFFNGTGAGDSNKVTVKKSAAAMVQFKYKVEKVTGAVSLRVAGGSRSWANSWQTANGTEAQYPDAFVTAANLAVTDTAGEWQTATVALYPNAKYDPAIHIFLEAVDKTAVNGTSVLIDDVTVISDYASAITITLDCQYGDITRALAGVAGQPIITPVPTRAGYLFGGWYTDAACTEGTEVSTEAVFTAATTYYAKWTPDKGDTSYDNFFTCNFDLQPVKDGGEGKNASASYKANATGKGDHTYSVSGVGSALYVVETGANGVVDDADHNGLVDDLDGNGTANEDADKALMDDVGYMELKHNGSTAKNVGFRVFGDYGSWNTEYANTGDTDQSRPKLDNYYRVAFDYNVINLPMSAIKLNLHVADGSLGVEAYGTSGLVASYTLTEVGEGTVALVIKAGDDAALRIGMGGIGVSSGVASEGTAEVRIDNIVCEYIPSDSAVTINGNHNDGTDTVTTTYGAVGTYSELPADPTRDGYDFDGWYTDADCTAGKEYDGVCSADITNIYAKWVEHSYIAFETNGLATVEEISGTAGTAATLPTPVADSYRFVCWQDAAGDPVTATNFPETGGERITLYAQWMDTSTVTLDGNGYPIEHMVTDVATTGDVGTALTLPTPKTGFVDEDYVFTGWVDKDGNPAATTYTEADVTYYANYELITEDYNSDTFVSVFDAKNDVDGSDGLLDDPAYMQVSGNTERLNGPVSGNGSGVILSYAHNYTTDGDCVGTSSADGLSLAMKLTGNNPGHIINRNGEKYQVKNGNAYTVTFMAYAEEETTVTFALESTSMNNAYFKEQGARAVAVSEKVTLAASQWTPITLHTDSLVGYETNNRLCAVLSIRGSFTKDDTPDLWGKYVYVDNIAIDETPTESDATMTFTNDTVGSSLKVSGDGSITVVEGIGHPNGDGKSVLFNSHWSGATRAAMLVKDKDGNNVKLEAGKSYIVSYWLYAPSAKYAKDSVSWWLVANNEANTFDKTLDGNGSLGGNDKNYYLYKLDSGGSSSKLIVDEDTVVETFNGSEWSQMPIAARDEWVLVQAYLNNVQLPDVALNEDGTVKEGYDNLIIGIGGGDKSYPFYVDDLTVREYTPDTNVQSYELSAVGTDLKINTAADFSATVSDDMAHTGNNSILFYTKKGASMTGTSRAQIQLTDEYGNAIKVEKGERYQISYWAYLDYAIDNAKLTYWYCSNMGGGAISGSKDTFRLEGDREDDKDWYSEDTMGYSHESGTWVQVTDVITINHSSAYYGYLLFSPNKVSDASNFSYSSDVYLYIDDIMVTKLGDADNTSLNYIQSVWQFKGGTTKDSSGIEAAVGSAVFEDNGTTKTAMRVAATYKTDVANHTTVKLGKSYYTVKQRGILLGKKGADLHVVDNGDGTYSRSDDALGWTEAPADDIAEKYWDYKAETGTVTYTMLVKITEAWVNVDLVARAYMIVDMGDGTEYILYSDTSVDFTPQEIYDAANAEWKADTTNNPDGKELGWFTETAAE